MRFNSGFTLVESIIGAAVFVIVAVSTYKSYVVIMEASRLSRLKIAAVALSNEQFEIIRNLSYSDIGVSGGNPSGLLPATQTLVRSGIQFVVDTAILDIDDPFDGVAPSDITPSDYKLAQVSLSCPLCKNFQPLDFVTYIAPRNLEED